MHDLIERTREALSDPDASPAGQIYLVGLLAIGVIAAELPISTGISESDANAARTLVQMFYWKRAVAS